LILTKKKSILYVADTNQITLFDLKLKLLTSWKYPVQPTSSSFLGLKVDGNILYLTIYTYPQIFSLDSQDGKLVNKWGAVTKSSKQGEFNEPMGLTVNDKYVYVCDQRNHRIQLLFKENGKCCDQWGKVPGKEQGQFTLPYCIYYHLVEEMFYIGDDTSAQVFSKNGVCVQRIGEESPRMFGCVFGVSVIDDQLFVSEYALGRIHVFKRVN